MAAAGLVGPARPLQWRLDRHIRLHDKRPLRAKVLHRLEASMKPPSAEALAAAAAVPTRPRKVITVSAADLEWITSHGPCSE